MTICKAKLDDLNSIVSIANLIKIKDNSINDKGFLVYVLDKKGYEKRIQYSKYFYVAKLKDKIIGFLMCYGDLILQKLKSEKLISHEDKIIDFVLAQNKPFVFGDQIGILYNNIKTGTGGNLMNQLLNDMRKDKIETMYVAILHKPVLNVASQNFCKKMGFKFIKEIENNDKMVWGVYFLDLN